MRAPAGPPGRVLHAITEFGALSETFISERMVALEALGWQTWVATKAVHNRDVFGFPPDERLIVARNRERLLRRCLGVVPGHRGAGSWWLERAIAAARPALVHAHFGWSALEALDAVERHRLPLVAGFHGYDVTVFPTHGFSPAGPGGATGVYDELFARVDVAVVVSRFLQGRLRGLGYDGEVHVVPSGIRLGDFPFRGPRPADGAFRLLFVGRLVEYKGLDVLLRALPAIASELGEVQLDVVGDGPQRAEWERLAAELAIAGTIAFHGARPRRDVVRSLQAADM
ncbi:MAG: glycosyltransferase, partial [Solirubrobacteraceae bacterium]